MLTADRKEEVVDEFVAWATGIIKEKINESFKVPFCCCAPMHASGCHTNLTQIYAWTPLEWVVKVTHFVRDDVVTYILHFAVRNKELTNLVCAFYGFLQNQAGLISSSHNSRVFYDHESRFIRSWCFE